MVVVVAVGGGAFVDTTVRMHLIMVVMSPWT